MDNIKIALITGDKAYGRALGLALVDVYRNFTVTLFQSTPLHNELDGMDLVLADSVNTVKIRGKNIGLTEKLSQINRNYDENIYSLYKYSNVRTLASELLFIYTSLTGRKAVPVRNSEARIVVFGTAEGGSGCTSASIAFAREMCRFHGKKVMYISLEEIESTAEYTGPVSASKNISEYLYHLFETEDGKFLPFIESYVIEDQFGISYFAPSPGRNVLNSLSREEMQYFIGAVMDSGGYDMMVIDAANSIAKPAMTCYEMANNICFVSRAENSYKLERFLEYFIFVKGEKIMDRMGLVLNFSEDTEAENRGIIPQVCRLPYEPESFGFSDGIREIRVEGEYGRGISSLTDKIIKNCM